MIEDLILRYPLIEIQDIFYDTMEQLRELLKHETLHYAQYINNWIF
jgi:hypothetical protein